MIRQQSCRAGFSLCACSYLAHRGQAYSAAEWQRARQLGLSVVALHPHFDFSEFTDFSRSPTSLSSRCAFYSTEFGQGGCPDTLVLLCLRVWYRSTLHSVLVRLLGSLVGKHTPVSLKGSHAVVSCRNRWS